MITQMLQIGRGIKVIGGGSCRPNSSIPDCVWDTQSSLKHKTAKRRRNAKICELLCWASQEFVDCEFVHRPCLRWCSLCYFTYILQSISAAPIHSTIDFKNTFSMVDYNREIITRNVALYEIFFCFANLHRAYSQICVSTFGPMSLYIWQFCWSVLPIFFCYRAK